MKKLTNTYLSLRGAIFSASNVALRVYATVAMVGFYLFGSSAFATPGVGQLAAQMMTEVGQVGRFIVALSYMCAFGVGMFGAFKLREASKQQSQATYKEALMILLVAGLLAVITTVVGAASGTIFTSGQDAAPSITQPSFTS